MTLHAATYWRVTCDAPGCDVDTARISDFSAWDDPGSAEDDWHVCDGATVGDKHYCRDHRPIEDEEDD